MKQIKEIKLCLEVYTSCDHWILSYNQAKDISKTVAEQITQHLKKQWPKAIVSVHLNVIKGEAPDIGVVPYPYINNKSWHPNDFDRSHYCPKCGAYPGECDCDHYLTISEDEIMNDAEAIVADIAASDAIEILTAIMQACCDEEE